MRVCQPGPVAFQRAMRSAGRRSEMSFLGLSERGRPPFFTLARASMSDVSCGSSRYSLALITWASTRARSDFKVRREAFLEMVVTDDAGFAIVFARVLNLHSNAGKDNRGVCEIEAPFRQGLSALGRIEGKAHRLL